MAYGCIRGLESRGKHVPEDVSVVGVDDSLGDIVPDRRLATVRFDNKRVGMWAVDKIAGARALNPVWSTCCFRAYSSRAIRCAIGARARACLGFR